MATENYQWHEVPGPVAPDVPYHVNQALAGIDGTVAGIEERTLNLEIAAGTAAGGANDASMTTVYNNDASSFRQALDADLGQMLADQAAAYEAKLAAQDTAHDAELAKLTPVIDGWHDLTPWLRNGWKPSADTGDPRWRKVTDATGTYVEFRGQVLNPNVSGNSQMCYLNPKYAPKTVEYFGGINARTSISMGAIIGPDGVFTMWQSGTSGALRSLNTIKYWLD